jgi:hypothetical protein
LYISFPKPSVGGDVKYEFKSANRPKIEFIATLEQKYGLFIVVANLKTINQIAKSINCLFSMKISLSLKNLTGTTEFQFFLLGQQSSNSVYLSLQTESEFRSPIYKQRMVSKPPTILQLIFIVYY